MLVPHFPAEAQVRMSPQEIFSSNTIRIQDKDSVLTPLTPLIRRVIDSTLRRISDLLPVSAVTITVLADPRHAVPSFGIGGYTPNANTMEIYIDPAYPDLESVLPDRLARTVAHEAHHAIRQRGPGYGRTLLEAMITEGMADHFAAEVLRTPRAPWDDAFPDSEFAKYLEIARPDLDSPTYDYARWFLTGGGGLPRWTGYSLGFRLVSRYLASHPGQNATTLVYAPAHEFRPF